MKKKFSIYGNCQALPIAQIIMNHPKFSVQFEYVSFDKPVFMLGNNDIESVHKIVADVDVFIHQDISEIFSPELSSAHLRSLTKDSCICISIPSLYFTGYYPETTYLRNTPKALNRFSEYHDLNILLYHLGISENPINGYEAEDLYDPQLIIDNADDSIAELQHREKQLDTKSSEFIAENWKDDILFHSFNHPSRKVLLHIINQIISILEIDNETIPGAYEHLGETRLPIYKSVRTILRKNPEFLKISGTKMSFSEYIIKREGIYNTISEDIIRASLHLLSNSGTAFQKHMINKSIGNKFI
tara:strand:+ start:4958 stop:5860 length:903 start_codon:yes stop_codon:yes gene_type:complete